jgi:uncharacterized protein (TIGR02678 family)
MTAFSSAAAPLGSVRRARLARLREEAEPLVEEERRTVLRTLLQHPLLTPDGEGSGAFALVRRHRDYAADWFAHHAGWSLAATAEAVRLRKHPANGDDATRGAVEPHSGEPFTRARYALLCLTLAALERGDRQVTLGRLAEAVASGLASDMAFAEAGLAWSLEAAADRRDFVHALRLLLALGVLRRVQGDEERYLRDRSADALYNVVRPVLAALLAVRRSPSLVPDGDFEGRLKALLETTLPDTPDARNRALRTDLARRLLDDPVLYYDSLSEEARAYFDRQRGFLLPELAAATGLEPEVRTEGVALADLDGDCTDLGLPEEGTEGHLTLLVATWLAEHLHKPMDGAGIVTHEALRQQTARFIRKHRHHWRREVAEKGAEVWLSAMIAERLAGLGLLESREDGVRPLPALGRFGYRETEESAGIAEDGELPLFDS